MNAKLEGLWLELCERENQILKCNGTRRQKQDKRHKFMEKQREFDKTIKRTKRTHSRQKYCDIELMIQINFGITLKIEAQSEIIRVLWKYMMKMALYHIVKKTY